MISNLPTDPAPFYITSKEELEKYRIIDAEFDSINGCMRLLLRHKVDHLDMGPAMHSRCTRELYHSLLR